GKVERLKIDEYGEIEMLGNGEKKMEWKNACHRRFAESHRWSTALISFAMYFVPVNCCLVGNPPAVREWNRRSIGYPALMFPSFRSSFLHQQPTGSPLIHFGGSLICPPVLQSKP
ncbi:hypothetical protein HAX54_034176, partial [Datura stramonium]|nr:hypothetical protein [Datura stramonium]